MFYIKTLLARAFVTQGLLA